VRRFDFILWQDDMDASLAAAIGVAAAASEVVELSSSWWTAPKQGAVDVPLLDLAPGAVAVEWFSNGPGTALQISVFGPALGAVDFVAAFARRLALALGRPLLFSDCHVFPLVFLMAREDGAIVHVVVRDDDAMALLPDDPGDPDYWARDVLFAPGDRLPHPGPEEQRAPGAPRTRCAIFGGPCPKRRLRCL